MLVVSKSVRGFSLIELLLSLLILSILLGLAVPSFARLANKIKVQTSTDLFVSNYQLARNSAISRRKDTIYCPINTQLSDFTGQRCAQDWTLGAIAFVDGDGNLTIDSAIDIIAIVNKPPTGVQMRMRAGLNKQYLRFLPNGLLENTAGNLVVCPEDNEARSAKTVIFTRLGRLRFGTDKNQDGILENAEGQPISCPP